MPPDLDTDRDPITIRAATDDELDAVVELAGLALGWQDGEPNQALFTWKHVDNPAGRSPVLVAEADGRLLGVRALLRWRLVRGDEVVDVVRPVDTATHPDARGRGLFTRLTTDAIARETAAGTAFVFNTPNGQSRPGYLKMGWKEAGRVPTWVRPLHPSAPARMVRARTPADKWSLPAGAGDPPTAIFTDDFTAHLAPAPDAARWRTPIDGAFLRWRYGLAELGYRVVATDDAAAVYRRRRRGAATEVVLATVMGCHERARRDVLARLRRLVEGDYILAAGDRPPGTAPLPGQGPILTTRALARTAPTLDRLAFSLGDLELF